MAMIDSASPPATVLVVDDESQIRRLLARTLTQSGFAVATAADAEEALGILREQTIDAALVDLCLPEIDGIELVRRLKAIDPHVPCIVMTGMGDAASSVSALDAGAFWFLSKPFDRHMESLHRLIAQAVAQHRPHTEAAATQDRVRSIDEFDTIVGRSDALTRMLGVVTKVANSNATVLVTDESGTGKELVARALHYKSARARERFVAVNCAAIPAELLESELFGHSKGAFTHASRNRQGRFALADKGTIFLDEIGDMSPNLQAKLLRVLQEQTFEPVGESKSVRVDVRVVAATNQDLSRAIAAGSFRADLYYRLNVIPIEIPPLRSRREDIPLLVDHFVEKLARERGLRVESVTPGTMKRLCEYPWPGNIRELENLISRLAILSSHGVICEGDLPEAIRCAKPAPGDGPIPPFPPSEENLCFRDVVDRFESELILRALEQTSWNKTRAAQVLGVNRTTLLEMIQRKGLSPEPRAH